MANRTRTKPTPRITATIAGTFGGVAGAQQSALAGSSN